MKTSVFCAASIDGFIAKSDDGIEWLNPYEKDPHGFEEFFASLDAVVIGRRTFEVVLGFGGWFYTKPVFVLSSTLKNLKLPEGAVCELINAEPSEVLKQLEQRGFNHLYIDGGVTIQRFLRARLIDRMIITRVPILLGNGIPLFGSLPQEVQLKHVATRTYPTGLVQSEYEVAR
ncbi:MAG TPA: dihydrofolate reductase family protein [Candidatus Acidoferrales bacterium]|nr:dihydrofolate reductase family protein [Candidatus Acidoferrales bacterium]